MNKTELVNKISEKSSLSKKDSEAALKAMIESIEDALVSEEKVSLVGFGTFEPRERAAREGRNPRTKETIHIPASKYPGFKPSKEFKEKMNQ